MPEITLEIPADIAADVAERVGCGTPEIYYRLVLLGLKRRMQEHEV